LGRESAAYLQKSERLKERIMEVLNRNLNDQFQSEIARQWASKLDKSIEYTLSLLPEIIEDLNSSLRSPTSLFQFAEKFVGPALQLPDPSIGGRFLRRGNGIDKPYPNDKSHNQTRPLVFTGQCAKHGGDANKGNEEKFHKEH